MSLLTINDDNLKGLGRRINYESAADLISEELRKPIIEVEKNNDIEEDTIEFNVGELKLIFYNTSFDNIHKQIEYIHISDHIFDCFKLIIMICVSR